MSWNSWASVSAVPVIPARRLYILKKFWMVTVATVCVSCLIGTLSFASTAWCRPSDHWRPIIGRPVLVSTITMLGSVLPDIRSGTFITM